MFKNKIKRNIFTAQENTNILSRYKNQTTKNNVDMQTGSIRVQTENIFPIIKTNCFQCHDAKNHYGGIVIETYTQIAESGKSGELYNSIQINSSTGKAYMPKGGRLMDCEIALIQAWIKQGALNN